MKYIAASKNFTRINETSGTIQNVSRINTVEVSNQPVMNSGVLLPPQERFSYNSLTLYVRCIDGGGAEVRVVPPLPPPLPFPIPTSPPMTTQTTLSTTLGTVTFLPTPTPIPLLFFRRHGQRHQGHFRR